tara:strand:- start:35 stop:499 length:465 start_codon:yes stop_codon:yes gene_type:complete
MPTTKKVNNNDLEIKSEERLRIHMEKEFGRNKKIITKHLKRTIDSGVDNLFSSAFLQYGVMEIKDFDSYIDGIGFLDFLLACNFCLSNLEQIYHGYKKDSDFDRQQLLSLLTLISHTKYHWIHQSDIMKLAMFCEKLIFHHFVVDGYIKEFTTH